MLANNIRPPSPMRAYRSRKDASRHTVLSTYSIMGFISSGTYGRVYKARVRSAGSIRGRPRDDPPSQDSQDTGELVAIKKFKAEKEGEVTTYVGISQSACREIMLNRELKHVNIAALREVILEDKSIYLIFEFAEHDFLQIIHHHSTLRTSISLSVLKSLMWQLINGVTYLHDNWVIHRDLKPANILVTDKGKVKIGDLGLARVLAAPLQPLLASDKVVVTIWYRAPDLLLGARHYNMSIDMWSVGCIFGELLSLRPMFKGEETKMDQHIVNGKKTSLPLQRDQLIKIFEVLGTPNKVRWPSITQLPEYNQLAKLPNFPQNQLHKWFTSRPYREIIQASNGGFELLSSLLTYDPDRRITAKEAVFHKFWAEEPQLTADPFPTSFYPQRRITHDDSDPKLGTAAAPPPIAGSGSRTIGSKHGVSSTGSGMPQARAPKRVRAE